MTWLARAQFTIYPPDNAPVPTHLWTAEVSIPGHTPRDLHAYGEDPRKALDNLMSTLEAINPEPRTDLPTVDEFVRLWQTAD